MIGLLLIACTTQRIGQFTYTDCSDGTSVTQQDIGQDHYTDIVPPPRLVPVVPALPGDDPPVEGDHE